jgi:FdhD protein
MRALRMTDFSLPVAVSVTAYDEQGQACAKEIAAERALTIYLDKQEIVTLMTLGSHPELLVLGYLRNQNLVERLEEIESIQVDWEVEAAAVTTRAQRTEHLREKLAQRTVTTGCGQGTVFGQLKEKLEKIRVPQVQVRQSALYALLENLRQYNEVYKRAGAVHGCALASLAGEILFFCEDVGRHNAVDAIAGYMWLNAIEGRDKIFYTTGRLTSEMVIKAAQMEIPVLLSRSGITQMGLDLARQAGILLIARAKSRHFLVFNGWENLVYDAPPAKF